MSSYAGAMQSFTDFQNGMRRQYELTADGKIEYTHRHDGAFEIWRWPTFPALGHGSVVASEHFVEMYNLKMKTMNEHPERFNLELWSRQLNALQRTSPGGWDVLIKDLSGCEAAVGKHVRVEGVVSNTKMPQIHGIDIQTIENSLENKDTDLRDRPAWAEGILVRHIVKPEDVNNFTQNRGAGTFYELQDPATGQTAIAQPLKLIP